MIIVHGGAFITGVSRMVQLTFGWRTLRKKAMSQHPSNIGSECFILNFLTDVNLPTMSVEVWQTRVSGIEHYIEAYRMGGAIRYLITQKETYQINPIMFL
jgi:hypothetical protein